jgi:hypothetical protein
MSDSYSVARSSCLVIAPRLPEKWIPFIEWNNTKKLHTLSACRPCKAFFHASFTNIWRVLDRPFGSGFHHDVFSKDRGPEAGLFTSTPMSVQKRQLSSVGILVGPVRLGNLDWQTPGLLYSRCARYEMFWRTPLKRSTHADIQSAFGLSHHCDGPIPLIRIVAIKAGNCLDARHARAFPLPRSVFDRDPNYIPFITTLRLLVKRRRAEGSVFANSVSPCPS